MSASKLPLTLSVYIVRTCGMIAIMLQPDQSPSSWSISSCARSTATGKRAKEQISLEDAVNLDLPIVPYEMPGVSRDELDSATLVGEMGRRGHSAIGVDVEI
jgi:hypothetical protein